MDELFAEFERLIKELPGSGLTGALELLLRQLDSEVAEQLRLCAIPHQFDERLLPVLTPGLDGARAQALCADIAQLSVVLARSDGYALHDEAREHLFAWWLRDEQADTFVAVSARLADHFDRRAADTSVGAREQAEWQRMFHRLGADQAAGFAEFERLFRLMRHQFRLDACEALIHLVHEYDAVLTNEHAVRLVYHEGKLATDRHLWHRAEQLFDHVLTTAATDPVLRIKAQNRLGCVVAETHDWKRAIELQKAALQSARTLDRRGDLEYRVVHDLGAAYRDAGDLDEAHRALAESVTLAQSAADLSAQATAYNSLGTLWRKLGDTQQAIGAYEKSLEALSRSDDPYRSAQVYNNLGAAWSELHDWKSSEGWFVRSLEIKRRAGDTIGQAMTLTNLARVYQQRGEIDRAIEMLEQALVLFQEMHDSPNIALARRQVGRLHGIAGRFDAARSALTEAAAIFGASGNDDEAATTRRERDDLGHRRRVPRWLMVLMAFVGVLVIAVSLFAWWNNDLNTASRLLEQGRSAEALEILTRVLAADPSNAVALNNRGVAYQQLGRHEEAIADFSKSIELNPGDAIAYVNRGDSHASLNRLELALSDYQQAVTLGPPIALAYRGRGAIRGRLGQLDDAIADYTKALELEPEDAVAYGLRALAHQAAGRQGESVADFTRAIELDANDPATFNYRSLANFRLGRDSEALEDMNKAIALDPQSGSHWSNRGHTRFYLDQYDEALADLSKAIAVEAKSPNPYNHRGRVEMQLDRLDAALADFSKAIELDPSYAMAYGNRGFVHHLRGDRSRARADYLRQVDLERTGTPTSRPLVLLALEARQSGRSQEAADYCKQALGIIRAGEQNPYYRDEALSAAFCGLILGDTEAAISEYRRAATMAGTAARREALLRLGLLPGGTRGGAAALEVLEEGNPRQR